SEEDNLLRNLYLLFRSSTRSSLIADIAAATTKSFPLLSLQHQIHADRPHFFIGSAACLHLCR
ncbi:hypothetical protein, partial [Enterobacter hormaechei]|uniref:hypothetical protein n=1 Tax=Enterobacter hormaechei TaxID=158836 RepID=UPI001CA45E4D